MSADDRLFKRLTEPPKKPHPEPGMRWKCPQGHLRWAHEPVCPLCGADRPKENA
jgi:hypothetical protein